MEAATEKRSSKMPRKKWRKRLIRFLIVLLLLFGGAWYGVDHIAPYAIISPQRYDVNANADQFPNGILPAGFGLTFDEFDVPISDTSALDGFYIKAKTDSARGCFLILHGIGSCKEPMLSLAERLAALGFNVYLYDHRGHGQSGGQYISYGYREKHDVVAILNALDERYGKQRYGIWGKSYGGAVALQAMSIEPRLELGIIESTFSELNKVVLAYQERMLGISSEWLAERVLTKASAIAEFNPDEVKPVVSAKHITAPVLIVHGAADQNIPIEHGRDIFHALKHSQRSFYAVEGADHNDVWSIGGQAYEKRVFGYLEENW